MSKKGRTDRTGDWRISAGKRAVGIGIQCYQGLFEPDNRFFGINELLNGIHADAKYGIVAATDNAPLVMIEYSSPNTNKPLHLGHVRNNLLGNALANIISANGNRVVKTNIVNDRGIHICKSMLAWQKYGNGETPESSGKKGDHLIGDYYVAFDKHYKAEVKELMAKFQSEGMSKEEAKAKAEAESPLMKEAREMLVKWEAATLRSVLCGRR